MKKLMFSLTVAVFALTFSSQADNATKITPAKPAVKTTKDKSACCADSCCKSSCKTTHPVLMSPRAAAAAGK